MSTNLLIKLHKNQLKQMKIKQIIFDFMFNGLQPDEQEQINFSNYFEKWWKDYLIEEEKND